MRLTSAGLCEQLSTSGQLPDQPIQGLLHCASLHSAPRFALEETGGRRWKMEEEEGKQIFLLSTT